jgi:hypothetical protein
MAWKAKRRAQESREAGKKKKKGASSVSNHSKDCSTRVNLARHFAKKAGGEMRGGEHASIFRNQFRE